MCAKACAKGHEKQVPYRRILIGAGVLVVTVATTIFLVWLILRPTSPQFTLRDTTLYAFNLSKPKFLTTAMQVTISTKNPNSRIGIYYATIDIYASYRNQRITLTTKLPSGTYLGEKDISVWSPFLHGDYVPLSPNLAAALCEDLNAGMVLVEIKVSGWLNWKVGTWISGKYHLRVRCPAYITSGGGSNGGPLQLRIKYPLVRDCYVDV